MCRSLASQGDATVEDFEGETDDRQAETPIKPSRFRPRHRQLTVEEKVLHDAIKAIEELYEQVKSGRYKALALTELEASVVWIVKELTA